MSWISFKPFFTAFLALLHPFFVSVIEINHNEKEATLEISVRTFTNDLEKMIQAETNTSIDVSQPAQKKKADALIAAYLTKRLNLKSNGIKCNLEYIGFEIQKESTWTYFEVKNVKQLKQLEVLCEVLFGINNQQINIIHVTHKGERKSYELIYPKNTTQFNF
jgi:myo-inositol-1-phosphate synthase